MKILLPFTLIFFLSCSTPNKVSWDNTKEDNVRHIGSKSIEKKIDNATYSFNLTVFSSEQQKYYCLLIGSIWRIENNGIVLFKLGNEETIKLTANNTNIGKVDWPSYSPIIGSKTTSGVMSTEKIDYYSSIYFLQDDIMNKIETYGIKKIRIQFGTTYKEQTWERDRLGKYIKLSHELLEQQLNTPPKKSKSIEQDF